MRLRYSHNKNPRVYYITLIIKVKEVYFMRVYVYSVHTAFMDWICINVYT